MLTDNWRLRRPPPRRFGIINHSYYIKSHGSGSHFAKEVNLHDGRQPVSIWTKYEIMTSIHDSVINMFLYKYCWIMIQLWLKCVPLDLIHNEPPLYQTMAWCRIGNKPLSDKMIANFTDAYMRHSASISYLDMDGCSLYVMKVNSKSHSCIQCSSKYGHFCHVTGFRVVVMYNNHWQHSITAVLLSAIGKYCWEILCLTAK